MQSEHPESLAEDGKQPRKERYTAYLVRCWQEGERPRYSIEKVGSNERRAFDHASMLLAMLKNELEGDSNDET